jgi:uncharacterized protein
MESGEMIRKDNDMKIIIAGSNGMIGSAVVRHMLKQGHQVSRLIRREPVNGDVFWNPDAGQIATE